MADVSKILKPRRGLASTMATAAKSGIVLAKGELFVEAPSTGMGTGASKVKIGDGTTAYSALPYALGDTSNDKIDFSSNTSTTVAAALNSVVSGNSLKTLIAGLKQAISLCNTSITQLNDDITSFQTGVDTIYNGCKTYGSTPTASTPTAIVNAIKAIYTNRYNAGVTATKKGTATAAQVLTGYTFTNSSSVGASGTMANKGAVTGSITTSGGSYTIPAGYHNGSGKVTGPTLASLIGSNVTLANAANLLTGYTAYGKSGTKYTGSMKNNGAVTKTFTPSSSAQSYTIPAGYHNGSGKVTCNAITAGTNKKTLVSNMVRTGCGWNTNLGWNIQNSWFNLTSVLSNYSSYKTENFLFEPTKFTGNASDGYLLELPRQMKYIPSTGILYVAYCETNQSISTKVLNPLAANIHLIT